MTSPRVPRAAADGAADGATLRALGRARGVARDVAADLLTHLPDVGDLTTQRALDSWVEQAADTLSALSEAMEERLLVLGSTAPRGSIAVRPTPVGQSGRLVETSRRVGPGQRAEPGQSTESDPRTEPGHRTEPGWAP